MPAGIETDVGVVAEFRAHYLYSGNAAKSARAVGLNERTARDIARRLVDDPEFTADRRRLRATALDELVVMRMRVARRALKQFLSSEVETIGGGENVTVIDKRPDYGKLVLDAEKNAHNLARFDAERDGEMPHDGPVIVINETPEPSGPEEPDEPAAA